jgi:thiosulfate/3-mercaptopyruvate sulfurtransferase
MGFLVTTSWLAGRLDDPNAVILDATLPPVGVIPPVDTHARYVAKHIPGAVFFDIEALSDRTNPLPHMLPPPEVFSRNMSELGIGDQMNIVIYEQEGVFSGPRAWWTLRSFGAQNVCLLDGGLSAWIEAGLPTHSGPVHRTPAAFRAKLDPNAVKDFSQIRQMIASQGQILDARSAGRFSGTLPEPRAGISSGHMPGAISIPYTELAVDGRLKSAEELRRIFIANGVDLERPITTTCGSGVTAAVLALGLETAGAKQVSLYDGSWSEYAARPEAVIEKTYLRS